MRECLIILTLALIISVEEITSTLLAQTKIDHSHDLPWQMQQQLGGGHLYENGGIPSDHQIRQVSTGLSRGRDTPKARIDVPPTVHVTKVSTRGPNTPVKRIDVPPHPGDYNGYSQRVPRGPSAYPRGSPYGQPSVTMIQKTVVTSPSDYQHRVVVTAPKVPSSGGKYYLVGSGGDNGPRQVHPAQASGYPQGVRVSSSGGGQVYQAVQQPPNYAIVRCSQQPCNGYGQKYVVVGGGKSPQQRVLVQPSNGMGQRIVVVTRGRGSGTRNQHPQQSVVLPPPVILVRGGGGGSPRNQNGQPSVVAPASSRKQKFIIVQGGGGNGGGMSPSRPPQQQVIVQPPNNGGQKYLLIPDGSGGYMLVKPEKGGSQVPRIIVSPPPDGDRQSGGDDAGRRQSVGDESADGPPRFLVVPPGPGSGGRPRTPGRGQQGGGSNVPASNRNDRNDGMGQKGGTWDGHGLHPRGGSSSDGYPAHPPKTNSRDTLPAGVGDDGGFHAPDSVLMINGEDYNGRKGGGSSKVGKKKTPADKRPSEDRLHDFSLELALD